MFGAKVFDLEWNGDPAAARNFSISKEIGDRILILDADEEIIGSDRAKIQELIKLDNFEIRILQHNYVNDINHGGFRPVLKNDLNYGKYVGYFNTPIIRLFRRQDNIFFEGNSHETVDVFLARINGKVYDSDILFLYYGFVSDRKKMDHYQTLAKEDGSIDARGLYLKGIAYEQKGEYKPLRTI